MEALRPVREKLCPQLRAIFRDPSRHEVERSLATEILLSYDADNPGQLADLLMDADEKQFPALFTGLQKHSTAAVKDLHGELDRVLQVQWAAPSPPGGWKTPEPKSVREIEAADGLLTDSFALCQSLPLDRFQPLCEALQFAGYRPSRLRPYVLGNEVWVAAIWTRDGRAWRVALAQSSTDLEALNQKHTREQWDPVDVAGYRLFQDDEGQDVYCALWAKSAADSAERRMYVGVPAAEHHKTRGTLVSAGFGVQVALHVFAGQDGINLYSGIVSKGAKASELTQAQFLSEIGKQGSPDRLLVEVALHSVPLARAARSDVEPEAAPDDLAGLLRRALWRFHRGRETGALEYSAALLKLDDRFVPALRLLLLLHLRRRETEPAREIWKRLAELPLGALERTQWQALVDGLENPDDLDVSLEKLNTTEVQGPLDVLPLLRVNKQYRVGEWYTLFGSLLSPPRYGSRIELPLAPQQNYVVRLTITPLPHTEAKPDEGFVVGLLSGARRFQATLNFSDRTRNSLSALENVDRITELLINPTLHKGRILQEGKTAVIECRVTPGKVHIICDGKEVVAWEGKPQQLSLNTFWSTPNAVLFLGGHSRRYLIHTATLESEDLTASLRATQSDRHLALARFQAFAALTLTGKGDLRRARQTTRVVESLSAALAEDPVETLTAWNDPLFTPYFAEKALASVLARHAQCYSAVWSSSPGFESRWVGDVDLVRQREQSLQLIPLGFRPVSISVLSGVAGQPQGLRSTDRPYSSLPVDLVKG